MKSEGSEIIPRIILVKESSTAPLADHALWKTTEGFTEQPLNRCENRRYSIGYVDKAARKLSPTKTVEESHRKKDIINKRHETCRK